jgi:hypothetical protein
MDVLQPQPRRRKIERIGAFHTLDTRAAIAHSARAKPCACLGRNQGT